MLEVVNAKVEGKEVTAVGPEIQQAQVIDLMDALKQSLAKRAAADGGGAPVPKKPPVKVARRAADGSAVSDKAQSKVHASKR